MLQQLCPILANLNLRIPPVSIQTTRRAPKLSPNSQTLGAEDGWGSVVLQEPLREDPGLIGGGGTLRAAGVRQGGKARPRTPVLSSHRTALWPSLSPDPDGTFAHHRGSPHQTGAVSWPPPTFPAWKRSQTPGWDRLRWGWPGQERGRVTLGHPGHCGPSCLLTPFGHRRKQSGRPVVARLGLLAPRKWPESCPLGP